MLFFFIKGELYICVHIYAYLANYYKSVIDFKWFSISYALTSLDKQNRSLPTTHMWNRDYCKIHLCFRFCFLEAIFHFVFNLSCDIEFNIIILCESDLLWIITTTSCLGTAKCTLEIFIWEERRSFWFPSDILLNCLQNNQPLLDYFWDISRDCERLQGTTPLNGRLGRGCSGTV